MLDKDDTTRIGKYRFDLHARIANRVPTKLGALLKTTAKNFVNSRVQLWWKQIEIRFALQHGGENIRYLFALKRLMAGKHFVQHATERKNIAALIGRAASRLLG